MAVRTLAFSIAVVTMLLTARAHAANKTWIGTDGGTYSTPGNWDPAGTPGTADSILFANGTVPSSYDINFDVDSTLAQLTVATNPLVFAGSSHTLSVTGASSSKLLVGRTGSGTSSAVLTSSLAQLNTTYATLGDEAGTSGTLNLVGGTFGVSGTSSLYDFVIGDSGAGIVNVTNGADVTVARDTVLALFGGSAGNVSIIGNGSTWTNSGLMWTGKGSATITVADGGTLSVSGGLQMYTGKLAGNGDVTAAVSNNNGTVAPSGLVASYGALHIIGSYVQATPAKLQIELAGTTPGATYDRLNVTGAVTLAGTLQVTLSSFTPAQNDVFDILDFTTRTGTFATVSLPTLPGSLEWDTSKLYVDGTIRVVLPGDFNNSGTVDATDYTIWRKGQGTTYTAADYTTWRTHFAGAASGVGSSLNAAPSVPEPASLTLTLLGTAAATTARRQQRGSRR
jgi:T5SS/PEP-CTERM-associated repeat protein